MLSGEVSNMLNHAQSCQACTLEVKIGQRKSNYISQVPLAPINACRGQKQPDNMRKSCRQKHIWEKIEGEMFIRTLLKTLLQIFCKLIPNFKIISDNSLVPDNNSSRNTNGLSIHTVATFEFLPISSWPHGLEGN